MVDDGADRDLLRRQRDQIVALVEHEEARAPEPTWSTVWKDGAASFFFRGTNGRWREVLGPADLKLYNDAAARLDPALRQWLEGGSLSAGDPQAVSGGGTR